MTLKEQIADLSLKYFEEAQATREHLHRKPELSFKEAETSAFIQARLTEWGIPFQTGFVNHGIVGSIEGNGSGKTIALRADMDALPIQEIEGRSYGSEVEGVMHACGHDVHMTSMLYAARILNETKDSWSGRVQLIFQPAEEVLPGGASLMIDEGAFAEYMPTGIFGQHVYPDLEVGKVGFRSGKYMASCDEIYITVRGQGGHAALPHKLKDPIVAASRLIIALQEVASRYAKTQIPTVLSIGDIRGFGATNVIPDTVELKGTFRTLDEDWRSEAHEHIERICEGVALSAGLEIELRIDKGYPFVYNNPELTESAKQAAIEYLGADKVVDLDIRMTAEDFAYYSQMMPGCFYRLGTRNESKGIVHGLHTSKFDVDQDSLKTGMGLMAYLAIAELKR